MRDMVYPWNNYDFNLNTLISNQYDPQKLGFSNKPYLDTFIKDMNQLPKYPKLIAEGPLLTSSTKPGISDATPKDTVKKKYQSWKEPYPGFSKEYPQYFPLTGERSDSYFVKVGYCPVKSKTNEKDCQNSGFQWFSSTPSIPQGFFQNTVPTPNSGKCYKPRYMYINNQSKPLMGMRGPITNIINDVKDLNPMHLFTIFSKGKSDNKDMNPLPCIEGFSNTENSYLIFILITIFLFIGVLTY
jgi:hypothetical protein